MTVIHVVVHRNAWFHFPCTSVATFEASTGIGCTCLQLVP